MQNCDTLTTSCRKWSERLWDLLCFCSLIGIWPRWIEPQTLKITELKIPFVKLPKDLEGLRIVAFSDLHMRPTLSAAFLEKITRKIELLKPDLILFLGDFICYSNLDEPDRLRKFFCSFKAPYGCYAVLGNHDYAENVSINEEGFYDVVDPSKSSVFMRAWKRLSSKTKLKKTATPLVKNIALHQSLIALINSTPFTLLHNESKLIPIKGTYLNVCGIGEYLLQRALPDIAYKNYNSSFPGITLLHNPDGFPLLTSYPGNLVISWHTHGGQINLPWVGDKLAMLENPRFKKGLFFENEKWLYVNRGVAGAMPFRWFAPPEIVSITLENANG